MRSIIRLALGFSIFGVACAEGTGIDGTGGTGAAGPVTGSGPSTSSTMSAGGGGASATSGSSSSSSSGGGGDGGAGGGASTTASTTDAATTTGAGGMGGAGGGPDVTAPTVLGTFPLSGTTGISPATKIDVTFSEPMDAATITTHTGGTCSGSVQVSADNFATCVPMMGQPVTSDDVTFSLTPVAPLASLGSYRLRVQTSAKDAAQNALAQAFQLASPFTVRFFHSITIDGVNDFVSPGEAIPTSTAGAQLYVTHDEQKLYLALQSPDVTTGGGNKFVYFLFSTDTALATGSLESSDAKAKFGSGKRLMYHYKERIAGGIYSEYRISNGTDWSTDWGTTGKTSFKTNGYLEASIELSQFGGAVPSALVVTAFTVDYAGGGGNGWVYNMLSGATDGSGVPARDLVKYLRLQLPATVVPNTAANLLNF